MSRAGLGPDVRPPATLTLRACLRMRATCCVSTDGEPGVLLALRDTTGLLHDDLSAQWLGARAVEFMHQHLHELVPGRCVDVELHHLRAHTSAELRARVKTCALAPLAPSWVKHASTLTTNHQESQAS